MSRTALLVLVLALAPLALAGEDPSPPAPPAPAPGAPPAQPPPEVPDWAKVSDAQKAAAKEAGVPVAFENSLGMRFVLVPSGAFQMGSPEREVGRALDETLHEVVLTKPFYMGITEVTNGQYRRWKRKHDSGTFKDQALNGDEQPVVRVRWFDAKDYAKWLSGREQGRTYRLPTEAEWERACRAGTGTVYWWGDSAEEGWRYANASDPRAKEELGLGGDGWPKDDGYLATAPVGSYPASGYGLYDMLGNVLEWCGDVYGDYPSGRVTDPSGPASGKYRVLRGGSWGHEPRYVRSAVRVRDEPRIQIDIDGFRLVSPLPASR